jgi:RNA polymerase sigma-70 factor (ECF subfamily)
MKICMLYTADTAEAIEVLNTAFYFFFLHPDIYYKYAPFEVTLNRFMIKSVVNWYKESAGRERQKDRREDYYLEDSTLAASLDKDVLSGLSQEESLGLLKSLPLSYRVVYNLFVVEHYGHEEISKLLSITAESSELQLIKARALLKNLVIQLSLKRVNKDIQ